MNKDNTNKLNHLKPKEGPVVTYTMVDMNLITHAKKHKFNLKQPVYMTNIPKSSLMKPPQIEPARLPLPNNYHHNLPEIYNGYHHRHLSINFGFGSRFKNLPIERNYIPISKPVVSNTQPSQVNLTIQTDECCVTDNSMNDISCSTVFPDIVLETPVLDPIAPLTETTSLENKNESESELYNDNHSDILENVNAPVQDSLLEPLPLSPFQNDIPEDLKTSDDSVPKTDPVVNDFKLPFQVNLRPINMEPITKMETGSSGAAFLMISLDGGDTWKEPKLPPPKDVKISVVAIGKKVQVCGGQYDSLYHSFDGGDTWDKCKNQPQIHDWTAIIITGDEDERIEAKTRKGDMYVSTDLGNNWAAF